MGGLGASVIAGLVVGGIAALLALVLNWFQRPRWATTGRLVAVVLACVALGALAPFVFRQTVSVEDVAGSWAYSSSVSVFTTTVALNIGNDGTFEFAMTLNTSNPPLSGETNVACSGIVSSGADSAELRATSGSCSGLSVKPGPTRDTLDVTSAANGETMTLRRTG